MAFKKPKGSTLIILSVLAVIILFFLFEGLFVVLNGGTVPTPKISREPNTLGSGTPLTYVVMGDSTAAGQGGDYSKGIATTTASDLAQKNKVTFVNLAISGSRAKDVATEQLPKAVALKPDVVLISVGANDVTHLTSYNTVVSNLKTTTQQLITANCKVKIVLTGSPAMGSVPRFAQPLRYLAGQRTKNLNVHIDQLVGEEHLTRALVAEKTGPVFAKNPALFAEDKFHPNNSGYAVWNPVLTGAIDQAMASQPDHCK